MGELTPSPYGSFPIQLKYKSGITPYQEASWVGLGWELSPGYIKRQLNQFPDDMNGAELISNYFGTGDYEALWNISSTWNRNGKNYNIAGGTGSLLKMSDNKYSLKYSKSDIIYGSLYQSNMPVITRDCYATSRTPSRFQMRNKNKSYDEKHLVFESANSNNQSTISDIYQNTQNANYYHVKSPVFMAFDNYIVNCDGIAGSITPIRYDSPSIASPYEKENRYEKGRTPHTKFSVTPVQTNKVQFIYKNESASKFNYQLTVGNGNFQVGHSSFLAGQTHKEQELRDPFNSGQLITSSYGQNDILSMEITSNSADMYPDHISVWEVPPAGEQWTFESNKNILQPKSVKWYTQTEVINQTAQGEGLVLPDNSICLSHQYSSEDCIQAFMITGTSGLTYHFSLPVFSEKKTTYTQTSTSSSTRTINTAFAVEWLLTAITGPDFKNNGDPQIGPDDEGYYVKFEYGKFVSEFRSRFPYEGSAVMNETWLNAHEVDEIEQYYLNAIKTPTHTALFVKDYRTDGKSHSYTNPMAGTSTLNRASNNIRHSLRLEEIILVKNSDMPNIPYNIGNDDKDLYKLHDDDNPSINNCEGFDQVLLTEDIDWVGSDLEDVIIKRVKLTHDYSLCEETQNSFEYDYSSGSGWASSSLSGKLTLKKVSTMFNDGQNNFTSVQQPYKFRYQTNNPDFHLSKIDGWGFYKNTNSTSWLDRLAVSDEGSAWNLQKIIYPIGAEVTVNYERDRYTSVNGEPGYKNFPIDQFNNSTGYIDINTSTDLTQELSTQTLVYIQGEIWEECDLAEDKKDPNTTYKKIQNQLHRSPPILACTVLSVTSNSVKLSLPALTTDVFDPNNQNFLWKGNCKYFFSGSASVLLEVGSDLIGGDVRVVSLVKKDSISGTEYTITYDYNNENGVSTGVSTSEPEMILAKIPTDYLRYMVMEPKIFYHQVKKSVVSNELASTLTLHSTEFIFETPHKNKIKEFDKYSAGGTMWSQPSEFVVPVNKPIADYDERYLQSWRKRVYHISDRTSEIGLLISKRHYNQYGDLIEKTTYEYDGMGDDYNEQNRGQYTNSCILFDKSFRHASSMPPLGGCPGNDCDWGGNFWKDIRFINTILEYKTPSLKKTSVEKNGITYSTEILEYDLNTGFPTFIKETKNGINYYHELSYAFNSYSQMGLKTATLSNYNMLSLIKRKTTYGDISKTQVLSSSKETFGKNLWGSNVYGYKPLATLIWDGAIEDNGTYLSSGGYAYSHGGSLWKTQKEVTKYDKFSTAIETYDGVRNYNSKRKDNDDIMVITTAKNSRLCEFTHSSAELETVGAKHEGDVEPTLGAQRIKDSDISAHTIEAHSGDYVFELDQNEKLVFIGDMGNTPITDVKKKYHFRIWEFYEYASDRCTLNVKFRGGNIGTEGIVETVGDLGTVQVVFNAVCDPSRFGDWILHTADVELDPGAGNGITYIEATIENTFINTKYFDDFRFQPNGSIVEHKIYDEYDRVSFKLNNQNIGSYFEYDPAGVIKIIKNEVEYEVIDPGPPIIEKGGYKKVKEFDYHFSNK